MVSHGVFAGGHVHNKLAKDAVRRLRGGKNVCSYLCCHTRASWAYTRVIHASAETIQYSAFFSAMLVMQKDQT